MTKPHLFPETFELDDTDVIPLIKGMPSTPVEHKIAVADLKTEIGGGGGGGGGSIADARWQRLDGLTSTHDDEFDDGTLDPAWVRVDAASGAVASHLTWTEQGHSLSAHHSGTDTSAHLHALLKPMGSLGVGTIIEGSMQYAGISQGSPMAGLMFADGTSHGSGTQIISSSWNTTAAPYHRGGIRRMTSFNTNAANLDLIFGGAAHFAPLHVRLAWVGTNSFQFSFSADGISWVTQAAQAYTCTPTHFGFYVSSWAATGDFTYTYEYFRVIEPG
jgi:hypothetical protein